MTVLLTVRADEISLPNLLILLLSVVLIACAAKLIILTGVRLIILVGECLQMHAVEHDFFLLGRAASLRVLTIIVLQSLFSVNLLL